jgi:uncharacterized protein YfaS (alpha-2-macroglobulin family)
LLFTTYNEFSYTGSSKVYLDKLGYPSHEFYFLFSNPVYYSDLLKHLTLKPEVKLPAAEEEYGYSDDELYLSLSFKPQTSYTLVLDKELKDIFGQKLGKEVKISLRTGNYAPQFSMSAGEGIMEAYGSLKFPVQIINIPRLERKIAVLTPDEIIPQLLWDKTYDYKNIPPPELYYPWQDVLTLNPPKNKPWLYPLDLKSILPEDRHGLVYLNLADPRDDYVRKETAWLQVTELGITAKFSPENNLILVSTLKDAQPAPYVNIEIRSDANQVLWSGYTNSKGWVETPGWAKLGLKRGKDEWSPAPRQWVFAYYKQDLAVLASDWNWGIEPYNFDIDYTSYQREYEYQGEVFSERGIYRPGEKVHLKGILREKHWGKWELPKLESLTLTINNSRQEKLLTTKVNLNDYGAFAYTVNLPPDAPTGYYRVRLTSPSKGDENLIYGSFQVQNFEPALVEVTVSSEQESYMTGDKFKGKLKGWYLFGAPAAQDEVSWTLTANGAWFRPPGYESFDFNTGYYDEESSYYERDYEDNLIASGSGKLDAAGEVQVEANLPTDKFKRASNLTLEGTVTTPNRQSVSGRKSVLVHPGEFYIGIKPATSFLEGQKPLSIALITVKPQGEALSGEAIEVNIYRREWHSVRQAENGRYEWRSEKVDKLAMQSKVNSPAKLNFNPKEPGFYIIKASGRDKRGNLIQSSSSFYVCAPGYVPWARNNDDRIELVANQKKYAPGDTAKILIKSPYEQTKALITIEREYIMERRVVDLKGSAPTFELPIKSDYLPNVFVSVMLLQGRVSSDKFSSAGEDLGKPAFKIGYLNLPVESKEKKLSVEVTPSAKVYRPKDKVTVKLRVLNAKQQGVKAEVTLTVADVGVLNLVDYQTPDYFNRFYGMRPLSVYTAESRQHIIGDRNYGQKGDNRGGGGGKLKDLSYRTEFKPTAYWNPCLYTDAEGYASVSFTLPEDLTTFRLMATAHTKDSCFGSGENTITVNKPLMLKPSLPAFARIGDSFQGGVLVHNGTKQRGKVRVIPSIKGITWLDPMEKFVELGPGEAKEVLFSFKARQVGTASFAFAALMGKEKDGLTLSIPVKMPVLTEAVALFEDTVRNAYQELIIPKDIYPGSALLECSLASTALTGLKAGVENLIRYPYECLEQKLSRILPLILAEEVVNTFDIPSLKGKELRQAVQEVLDVMPGYQNESGEFEFYPGKVYSNNPYLTAYALYVVAKAKAHDYTYNSQMVHKALAYVKNKLAQDEEGWSCPYSYNEQLTTKAFMLYALALWKEQAPAYLGFLYHKLDQLSLWGKTMLLKSAYLYNQPEMVQELATILTNKIKVAPSSAHFEEEKPMPWIFSSNLRTTALILQSLLEVQGKFTFAPRIARWLMQEQSRDRYCTTQENAYLFEALSTYIQNYEEAEPDFTAQVLLANQKIMKASFKGRKMNIISQTIDLSDFAPGRRALKINKQGQGRLYYGIRMKYAPLKPQLPRDEGIIIFKQVEPLEGKPNADGSFSAGQVYKVTLDILVPKECQFVIVDDPVPAGCQVVNTDFATQSRALFSKLNKSLREKRQYRYWSFNHWEIYDDKVLLFADGLDAGEHIFTYLIKALHYGEFMQPACKAEEMYQPEVFGTTASGRVRVGNSQ